MTEPLLEVDDLKVHFPVDDGWTTSDRRVVRAVDGISLSLQRGEVLAVVGESGCGKTTLGRAVAGLANPTAGTIRFKGKAIDSLSPGDRVTFRRQVQMVFQDPYDSMNPLKTAFQMIAQPLSINRIVPKAELVNEVLRLFDEVGLAPGEAYLNRSRHQLSGGERQRLSIARSISVHPAIIVADEPVSALDISIQGQILSLMRHLQESWRISYLFVSHDLAVVRSLADRVMIVYLGQVAEARSDGRGLQLPPAPLHRGVAGRASDPRSRDQPFTSATGPHRGRAFAHRSAFRLPIPYAVPDRGADLFGEAAVIPDFQERPPGRLPFRRSTGRQDAGACATPVRLRERLTGSRGIHSLRPAGKGRLESTVAEQARRLLDRLRSILGSADERSTR